MAKKTKSKGGKTNQDCDMDMKQDMKRGKKGK